MYLISNTVKSSFYQSNVLTRCLYFYLSSTFGYFLQHWHAPSDETCLHDPEWSWNPAALLTNTFSLTKCRPRLDLVLTSRPPSAPQRAAVLLPPAHRQTLHQEEGEHGDGELPESCHEGAAQQVTTTVLINMWSCDIVVELEADHESIWCLRRCDVET